jgi:catechol 2,3-dioxygenase
VELDSAEDVAAVRARVASADDVAGGFVTRDPWGTAVAFVAA